ncbi:MAG TPA: hypothetical protein VIA62_16400 [Thermoanaerobaculia bacterium]|jgi:hypothetical protein|nr:hypothetical protein [Thermoanaerobaculia bacterium]
MSAFLIVPEEEKVLSRILPLVGGERMSLGSLNEALSNLREAAGGVTSRFKSWWLYEVPMADEDRLMMATQAIAEQLQEKGGEAVIDLEARLLTLVELQAVAAGMGLSLGFVAVLKPKTGEPPPLIDPLDQALMAAIQELGGSASTGQLAARLNRKPVALRKRLQVLSSFGRLVSTGIKGGARYSLPDWEP